MTTIYQCRHLMVTIEAVVYNAVAMKRREAEVKSDNLPDVSAYKTEGRRIINETYIYM